MKKKLLIVLLALSLLLPGCTESSPGFGSVNILDQPIEVTGNVTTTNSSVTHVRFINEAGLFYGIPEQNGRPWVTPVDLNMAIPASNMTGMMSTNKFGRNTSINNGVTADIWDGGATGGASLIWVAPTADRFHNIVSTSVADNITGAGTRTIQIYGLDDWTTAEITEIVSLNGTTNVLTANDYVIIYRMEVLTKGGSSINVGTITATAVVDLTVTAQINPTEGQTQMAIFAWPSTQTAFIPQLYATMNRGSPAAAAVDTRLCFNPEPDVELLGFQIKLTAGMVSSGTSHYVHPYKPYLRLDGPGLVKIQSTSGANGADVSAGLDIILVNN